MQIYQGSPKEKSGRNENEILIYNLLDDLGINFTRVDHEAVCSIDECKAIDEVLAPTKHCKNLFLCPTNKSKYHLLVMEENKKFNSGKFSKQVNSSRLQFGNDEDLLRYLGVKSGAVGVLALCVDMENKVQLLVDEDVLAAEYVTGHPGVNTSSVSMKTNDMFAKYIKNINHDYIVVKC